MAVKRQVNALSQMRLDIPIFRSLESAVSNDFDDLYRGLVIGEDKTFLIRGFEINMTGAVGNAASSLQMIVSNSAVLHGTDANSGTLLTIPTGTSPETLNDGTNEKVVGSFVPSATNQISLKFTRETDPATTDLVAFWSPATQLEFTKSVPLARVLDYQIIVSSTGFDSDALPIALVITDSSNNVISVTDQNDYLFRLGTGGTLAPDPQFEFPWSEGRSENPSTSTSSTSPFQGGDKQLRNLKDWLNAIMTTFKEIKGTPFWYSGGSGSWPGSLGSLRADTAHSVISGRGTVSHSGVTPGRMNWSNDLNVRFLSGRLNYKILANAATTDVILADNQVAFINLVRNQDVVPNLIFTNSSATVSSVGAVAWTSGLQAGDFVKVASLFDDEYFEILTVDSVSQVTLTETYTETSTGAAGAKAKTAFGVYQTDAAPSTDRHVKISNRQDVPLSENTYWLFFRDDNSGGTPRVYARFLGSEMEQGETRQVSDNTTSQLLTYMGSTGETDDSPAYSSNNIVTDGNSLTTAIGDLDTQVQTNIDDIATNATNIGIVKSESNQDRNLKMVGGGVWSWNSGTSQLSFTADAFIQVPDLSNARNTIQQSVQSPITIADGEVAYVDINRVDGGAVNLTVATAAVAAFVEGDDRVVIARRLGAEIIVGTGSFRLINGQSKTLDAGISVQNLALIGSGLTEATAAPTYTSNIRGTASEALINRISSLTGSMGDAQEDRSAYFRSDDDITWTGTQLEFTTDIVLEIINTKDGTLTAHTIALAQSPITLNDNESAYIAIDRTTSAAETIIKSDTVAIPAQTEANKDVFILARRKDTAGGLKILHIPLHKQALEEGQSVRLGASGAGGNGGGLDVFLAQDFEVLTSGSFTSGLNAVYKTAGTFGGALSTETTNPIAGSQSPKYTAGVTSTNDWFDVELITLDLKQKDTSIGITLYADTTGFTTDAEFVVWDETNSVKLDTTGLNIIEASTGLTRYSFAVTTLASTDEISYGFHMVTAPVNGESFIFDDVEFSTNPFVIKSLNNIFNWVDAGVITFDGTTSAPTKADTTTTDKVRWRQVGDSMELTYTYGHDNNTGSAVGSGSYLVDLPAGFSMDSAKITFDAQTDVQGTLNTPVGWGRASNSGSLTFDLEIIPHNATQFRFLIIGAQNDNGAVNDSVGEDWGSGSGFVFNQAAIYFKATITVPILGFTAETEHVITPVTDVANFFTATIRYSGGVPAVIEDNITGWIDSIDDTSTGDMNLNIDGLGLNVTPCVMATVSNGAGTSAFPTTVIPTATDVQIQIHDHANIAGDFDVDVVLFVQGADVKNATFLAAVPVQQVAFLKDEKSANTQGGTFTLGDWRTRDLNTTSGDSIVSLSANQFTLQSGSYLITAVAPAHDTDAHKIRLRNITDGVDVPNGIGTSTWIDASDGSVTQSYLECTLTITSSKTFEIQHRSAQTKATNGFGRASNLGVIEVYTQVKITKLR